jgi:hypothetical protein
MQSRRDDVHTYQAPNDEIEKFLDSLPMKSQGAETGRFR